MNIDNKYIHVEPIGEIKGKPAWAIVNTKSDSELACVCWYPSWRRYVMVTDTPTVFDVGCLESIIKFIQSLSRKRVE